MPSIKTKGTTTMYHVFTRRTVDSEGNPAPHASKRTIARVETEQEARRICTERNEPHDFRGEGKFKVFAEFTKE